MKPLQLDRLHPGVWVTAILLAGYLAQIDVVATGTLRDYIDLVYDDANYYLGVAFNLGNGWGSRFTEPLRTNGYQPLWEWLLAGIAFFLPQSKVALLVAMLTASLACKAIGIWLFGMQEADANRRACARLALFGGIGLFPYVFSLGMETTLFLVCLPLLLRASRREAWSLRHAWLVGSLASVCFLVRLDAASIFVSVLAVRWFCGHLRRSDGHAVVPMALTVAAYCLFNRWAFGTALPVSGQAKALGLIVGGNFATSLSFVPPLGWAALSAVSLLVLRAAGIRAVISRFELGALLLATILIAAYYGLFSNYSAWYWYFYTIAFLTIYLLKDALGAVVTACAAGGRPARTSQRMAVLAASIAVASTLLDSLAHPINGRLVPRYVAGQIDRHRQASPPETFNTRNAALVGWLDQNYPAGAVIAMGDRAGGLGLWMDRRHQLLQIEGLVGDKDLLPVIAGGALEEFLDRRGVALYVVDRHGLLSAGGIDGYVEPVQPRISRAKLNMFCFRQGAALLDQSDRPDNGQGGEIRRTYAFKDRVACPEGLLQRARVLQREFDGIRLL